MREVGWWRIKRPNGEALYGFGAYGNALALAYLWSEELGLDVDRYQVDDAPDYIEAERNDGFDISEAIEEAVERALQKSGARRDFA